MSGKAPCTPCQEAAAAQASGPFVTEIPDCLDRFRLNGQVFELDAFALLIEMRDLAEACARAGETHIDVLNELRARLEDRHKVQLTMGHADWLFDELERLQAQKKSTRAKSITGLLGSLPFTASTPAE